MTNERAIELLHRLQDEQFDGPHGDERREALEMAVRALEGDGDTIYRQQAIDAVVSAMIDGADAELVEGVMELLPSAQPVNYGSTKSDSSSQLKLNNDLISRQAAIDTVSKWFYDVFGITESDGTATIFKRLRELPSAQPERPEQPESAKEYCAECNHIEMCRWYPYEGCEFRSLPSAQPHGKWILETYQIRCSNCNKLFSDNLFPSNYCPNCGARMDGESDE